jgi:hypothetical protein
MVRGPKSNSPSPTVLACPICRRACAPRPVPHNESSFAIGRKISDVLFYHGGCPSCGIAFRIGKVTHSVGRLLLPTPTSPAPVETHPVRSAGPELPDPSLHTEFVRTAKPPAAIPPAAIAAPIETPQVPFLIEINNRSLGLHLRVAIQGGDIFSRLRELFGTIAAEAAVLCRTGQELMVKSAEARREAEKTKTPTVIIVADAPARAASDTSSEKESPDATDPAKDAPEDESQILH